MNYRVDRFLTSNRSVASLQRLEADMATHLLVDSPEANLWKEIDSVDLTNKLIDMFKEDFDQRGSFQAFIAFKGAQSHSYNSPQAPAMLRCSDQLLERILEQPPLEQAPLITRFLAIIQPHIPQASLNLRDVRDEWLPYLTEKFRQTSSKPHLRHLAVCHSFRNTIISLINLAFPLVKPQERPIQERPPQARINAISGLCGDACSFCRPIRAFLSDPTQHVLKYAWVKGQTTMKHCREVVNLCKDGRTINGRRNPPNGIIVVSGRVPKSSFSSYTLHIEKLVYRIWKQEKKASADRKKEWLEMVRRKKLCFEAVGVACNDEGMALLA